MRYLLDTNICIYIIKRSPPLVRERFARLRVGDVGISSITYCELEYGVARSTRPEANRAALAEFVAPLEILDFPAAAAVPFGAARAHLKAAGTPIGNYYDLLIAAHAMQTGLTLVTNNTREFARIPGLHVENWVDN